MILPEHLSKRNQEIIDRFGLYEQLLQLQEECAELIQAASKYRRAHGKENLAAAEHNMKLEMVDVVVVMEQVMKRLGMAQEELELMAAYKINRTIAGYRPIQKGKKHGIFERAARNDDAGEHAAGNLPGMCGKARPTAAP